MQPIIKGVSNDVLLISTLALAAGGAYLYRRSKSNMSPEEQTGGSQEPAQTPAATTPAASGNGSSSAGSTPAAALNRNLKLKKGSEGNEVRELQRLLGVAIDGDFGNNTETALVAKKGVKEVSLKEYDSIPNVNTTALATGTRIMANKKLDLPWSLVEGIHVYEANKRADGYYDLVEDAVSNVAYGSEVGTIRGANTAKTKYLVSRPGKTEIFGWVWASQVKKI